jgi:large subunit ribosomal protein L20
MARVKRAVAGRKKRNTLKERSKGYYGVRSRTFRGMKEQVSHSLQYQYRDRRNKKRDIRSLWIQRINAAARMNGLSYSRFMHGLKLAGIELDRKVLSAIAYEDEKAFADIAAVAKKALEEAGH